MTKVELWHFSFRVSIYMHIANSVLKINYYIRIENSAENLFQDSQPRVELFDNILPRIIIKYAEALSEFFFFF